MTTQGASLSSSPETPVSDQHDDDDFFVIGRFGFLHSRHLLMLPEELEDILLDTEQELDDLERNCEYGLLPKQCVRKCRRRTVKQKLSAYGM